ncbi:MAG: Ig-like domain-containing protein, partial [Verrucomicrobiales bacterium]|nr:Ig-like domain-containing protein [Verrucomicrobiales bacterium]
MKLTKLRAWKGTGQFPIARTGRLVLCVQLFAVAAVALEYSTFAIMAANTAGQPGLRIQQSQSSRLRISWPSTFLNFTLEQAEGLNRPIAWRPALESPKLLNGEFVVDLTATGGNSFFRLASSGPAPLTKIVSTSPAQGESGVSVTRETILRFDQPLSVTTVLTNDQFFAEFGGRRLLSRIELSSDRRAATLFYLEPLPGNARVRVAFNASAVVDQSGRRVDADGDGLPGGTAVFQFDTLSLTAVDRTGMSGRVFASELVAGPGTGTNAVNRPLAGVTITVDGAEETLRTVTDAQGNFRLEPCPAGPFFVHVDGRTSPESRWPNGAYYPFVGKAWEAIPGRTDNLAGGTGEIYLPLIAAGTLQSVSATRETTITFPPNVISQNPALTGVSITVPANSLFRDDGTRGGMVGIAPVPPNRLPGPLPPGMEFPLVITVQTDGASNFDRPVPACFPNLPDPATGQPLAPGAKNWLYSFNHDTGRFEPVGPMTVSTDGRLICTDSGVGIPAPGWHGSGPPPFGPPPPPPLCPAGSFAFHGGFSHANQSVAKARDPFCPPPEIACDVCLSDCEKKLNECRRKTSRSTRLGLKACKTIPPGSARERCYQQELKRYEKARTQCAKNARNCRDDCPCDSFLNLKSAVSKANQPPGDPVAERIIALQEQAADILLAFVRTGQAIPEQEIERASALLSQADQEAGGDADEYLAAAVAALEQERVAIIDHEDRGNAPSYPIRYAATILRPSGFLHLRGATEAFGAYRLFVPRDGVVLDIAFFDPQAHTFAFAFPNYRSNARYQMPRFWLEPVEEADLDVDRDGLAAVVEFVYGTDDNDPDSDDDGINDAAEIRQGTNPLDNREVRTGIVASAPTPGRAVDVGSLSDFVAVACAEAGVAIFNVFGGMNPLLVAQVPIPDGAKAIACSGNSILVLNDSTVAYIIDVSAPSGPAIASRIDLRSAGRAPLIAGGLGFAGLATGDVVSFDLVTGSILATAALGAEVQDLALAGEQLYALTAGKLHTLSLVNGTLVLEGSVDSQGSIGAGRRRLRLLVGGGIAYATHTSGYNTFDLSLPKVPRLLAAGNTAQRGWKQIVPNGSGLGVAAVSPNSTDDGPHDISLYDVSDPGRTDVFLTQFETPGLAEAVALVNGLAYVADGQAGLQVINYRPYDALGIPPSIDLEASFSLNPAVVDEGQAEFVRARATDDVQVAFVEFHLDGVRVGSDGSFPFEHYFRAPRLQQQTSFSLRARAVDTGGNATWTEEIQVQLRPDSTPPVIVGVAPRRGETRSDLVREALVAFSEPIDPRTLENSVVQVFDIGFDKRAGTPDDRLMSADSLTYRDDLNAAVLTFTRQPLSTGDYVVQVRAGVSDVRGNRIAADYSSTFAVVDISSPFLVDFSPAAGAVLAEDLFRLTATFNENLAPGSVQPTAFIVKSSGADGLLFTTDDENLSGGRLELLPSGDGLMLSFPTALAPERYAAFIAQELTDLAGSRLRQAGIWQFAIKYQTRVEGRVQLPDGTPARGAQVRVFGQPFVLESDENGRFVAPDLLLEPGRPLEIRAQFELLERKLYGSSGPLKPIHKGIADAGVITLRELCDARFVSELFPGNGPPGSPRAFAVFNDGTGPALYAGCAARLSQRNGGVYKWTGTRWVVVGSSFSDQFFLPTVNALVVFDDGGGPALFAAGTFDKAGGVPCNSLAKWDGKQWVPLGSGLTQPPFTGFANALAVYDDGSGPALFVGGRFTQAGGVGARSMAKWDGTTWTALAEGIRPGQIGVGEVNALAVFNDSLIAGGVFGTAGNVEAQSIARWNGTQWAALGSGTSGPVRALVTFNDGSGPALFVGGMFAEAGGVTVNNIAKWNGATWGGLAGGIGAGPVSSARVDALVVYDDGRGPALLAGGEFSKAGDFQPPFGFANLTRWNGTAWSSLAGAADPSVSVGGGVQVMIAFEEAGQRVLYVGGPGIGSVISQSSTVLVEEAARWDGMRWEPVGAGLQNPVNVLAEFNDGTGQALFVGGTFQWAGKHTVNGVAK